MSVIASADAVRIKSGVALLDGDLMVPPDAVGLVIFAHGSGSSRFSWRNRSVAAALQAGGFATLLVDLLTPREEAIDQRTREYRFDIPRLAARVTAAIDWVGGVPSLAGLPIILFGASTGAAAALMAAAERPDHVSAVISRGGRPDLAGAALAGVRAPTLLIVGGRDTEVVQLNRSALARFRTPAHLETVPWATHLFEEPGALEEVCRLALDWCHVFTGRPATSVLRTVPRQQWREFLARFSRAHTGWLVTVHASAGSESVASTHGRLQEVQLHGDALQLDLVDGARVYVARPGELRIQQRPDGAELALETENGEGTLMRVSFRAAARPEEVDGVSAWEAAAPLH